MDKILMEGMEFYGFHGILPAEQRVGQKFIVDLELMLDLRGAAGADDLEQTADYGAVYHDVQEVVTGKRFRLIEGLAEEIARTLLARHPLDRVLVRVKKPMAPVKGTFSFMGVEIERTRG